MTWRSGMTGGGREGPLPPGDVFGASAGDAALRVLATGALLSLGLSRDGGALGVTVTLDGEWEREWFRDDEACAHWLSNAADAIEAFVAKAPPPASQARGSGSSEPRRRRRNGSG